jgi:DMSO/TMAO reductase YedYZ heme-binding membrane subunit
MLLAYFFAKQILNYKKLLYGLAWVIVILVVTFKGIPFLTPFVKGFIGFAFFYVVMIAGALNPKWKLTKRLRSVRMPYSIIGFTILMAHPISYSFEIISQTRAIPWFGLSAFIVMVPLFITSYITIRKRMKPKTWVNLQKWAYLSYGLIFIHLIVNASSSQNRIVAIILLIPYVVLKLLKEFKPKKNNA